MTKSEIAAAIATMFLASPPAAAEPVNTLGAPVVLQTEGPQLWVEPEEGLFEYLQLTTFGGPASMVVNSGRIYAQGQPGVQAFAQFYNESYGAVVLDPSQKIQLRVAQVSGSWNLYITLGNPNYYAGFYFSQNGQTAVQVTQRGLLTLDLSTAAGDVDLSNLSGIGLVFVPQTPGSLTLTGFEVVP